MRFYLCIDDTDNVDSIGTGTIAEMIKEKIECNGWADCSVITRHQLLLHDDIPYTSHNSSMCFEGYLKGDYKELIKSAAITILKEVSAEGSDPGLCIAFEDTINHDYLLIKFGGLAKLNVLDKKFAYKIAKECCVHLSEHGGSGLGVIGALAGIGLRMTGNDGEVKGSFKKVEFNTYSPGQLLKLPEVEVICDNDYNEVTTGNIKLDKRSKTVMRNHRPTLFVYEEDDCWKVYSKKEIRKWES